MHILKLKASEEIVSSLKESMVFFSHGQKFSSIGFKLMAHLSTQDIIGVSKGVGKRKNRNELR